MGLKYKSDTQIIDFNEYKNIKSIDSNDDKISVKDLINVINTEIEVRAEMLANKNSIYYMESQKLKKECDYLREKLSKSIPIHTIIYLVINAVMFCCSLILMVMFYKYEIYIIDPYYLICICLISLGLFMTALVSLRDWKEYLNEKEKKKTD